MKRLSAILILILLTSLCVLPCLAEESYSVLYTADSLPHPDNTVSVNTNATVMMMEAMHAGVWEEYLEGDIQYCWYLDGALVAGANQDSFRLTEEHLGCYLQAKVTCGGVSAFGKSLLVTKKISPPQIMTSLLADATEGKPYRAVLECSDPEAVFAVTDQEEFSKTNLTLSSDGILSGTPQKAGVYRFTVTAENEGGTDICTYILTVNEPPHVHLYGDWVTLREPTCAVQGKRQKVCDCGETVTEWLDLTEHSWDEGVITTPPTEEEVGTRTHTCTVCNKTATSEVDKLPHTHRFREWTVVEKPTCHKKGYNLRTCACGETETEYVAMLEHIWDEGTITRHPTEETEGERTFTCTLCGDTKTESIARLTHTHFYGEWSVTKEPSCKEEGVKSKTCACGEVISETLPKTEHGWDDGSITKEPTEDEEGVKTFTCTLCGDKRTQSIPTLDHVHRYGEWNVTKSPSCKEEGVKSKTCACGEVISEALSKTDHVWDMGEITKEPAFDTDGERTFTCLVCKAMYTEPIQRDPHVHAYGEWTITKEATCDREGSMQKECICGDIWTQSIPKAEHGWDMGEVIKEATATEYGTLLYTCTVCGTTRTEDMPRTQTETPSPSDKAPSAESYYTPDSVSYVRIILLASCLATVFVGLLTWLVLKKNKNTSNG